MKIHTQRVLNDQGEEIEVQYVAVEMPDGTTMMIMRPTPPAEGDAE